MSHPTVRKAIIPAAGLGTRFLPATKASPKEMLPLVDKPLIQYVVEEAVASGIEHIIIVTGRGKRAIEDHFDRSIELEDHLRGLGRRQELQGIQRISELAHMCYIRQQEALGLGHAVLCAEPLIGNEPVAVLLGDEIIEATPPGLAQLIQVYQEGTGAVLGIQQVPASHVHRYGIIAPRPIKPKLHQAIDLVEKPSREESPSRFAVIGRYVLSPDIFPILRHTPPGKNGEIQLTDALRQLRNKAQILAWEIQGARYDAGDKLGFLKATVDFGLKHPTLGADFSQHLQQLNQKHTRAKAKPTR